MGAPPFFPRAIALFTAASCALTALPAAADCQRDPLYSTLKADCRFGNQNIYFQNACIDLYRFSAMADNVEAGSRSAIEELKANVDKANATPIGDQIAAYGRTRGIAMAGIQTANLHLSAAQLLLAKLLDARKTALDSLKEVAARNQSDAATLDYLTNGTGILTDPGSQALRQAHIKEFTEKVQGQAKAKTKLEEGIKKTQDAEKKLRALRADLAGFKNASTSQLAGLPNAGDKAQAASEKKRTEQLSKDDQGLYDKIKMNCFQNNGIRAGCSRALEGLDMLGFVVATGGMALFVRKVIWETFKDLAKAYFSDDTMRQLIICGQGKAFPVIDLPSDEDLGQVSTAPF